MNLGFNTLGAGSSGLSLVRILGSLSRTMGIVKQFAPIYKEVKPLIQKAPVFFQKLNLMRNNVSNFQNASVELSKNFAPSTSSNDISLPSSNGPVFFQ